MVSHLRRHFVSKYSRLKCSSGKSSTNGKQMNVSNSWKSLYSPISPNNIVWCVRSFDRSINYCDQMDSICLRNTRHHTKYCLIKNRMGLKKSLIHIINWIIIRWLMYISILKNDDFSSLLFTRSRSCYTYAIRCLWSDLKSSFSSYSLLKQIKI